jgi:hypothetical protein
MGEKIIHLKTLDVKVDVPDMIHYQDDGAVKDVQAHAFFLIWKYGRSAKMEPLLKKDEIYSGRLFYTQNKDGIFFHSFYLNNQGLLDELTTRAHEETHFIHAVKRLPNLSFEIKKRTGANVDFTKISSEFDDRAAYREVVANIGSVFTLHEKFGLGCCKNYAINSELKDEYFIPALSIYLESFIK